jgi:hypothetical protein
MMCVAALICLTFVVMLFDDVFCNHSFVKANIMDSCIFIISAICQFTRLFFSLKCLI